MVGEMAGLQSQSGRRVQSTVAVEKLTRQNNGRKHFALGSPTNDVLSFPRHFLSLQFGCLGRKGSFSTATPDFNSYERTNRKWSLWIEPSINLRCQLSGRHLFVLPFLR